MNIVFVICLWFGVTHTLNSLALRVEKIFDIQEIITSTELDGDTYKWGFFGGVVSFSENTRDIFRRPEQVAGLALQGFREATQAADPPWKPAGMAVLLEGKEVYFASPLRNRPSKPGMPMPFFMYLGLPSNARIRQQLLACQLRLQDKNEGKPIRKEHNTGGSCGEIVAMQMWHLKHPDKDWPGNDQHTVATAAFWLLEARGNEVKKIINPCGGSDETSVTWGCRAFARTHGIDWISGGYDENSVEMIGAKQTGKIVKKETVKDLTCFADNPQHGEGVRVAPLDGAPLDMSNSELEEILDRLTDDEAMEID